MKITNKVDMFFEDFKREDIQAGFTLTDSGYVVIDLGNDVNIFLDDFSQYKILVNKLYADMKKMEYQGKEKGK